MMLQDLVMTVTVADPQRGVAYPVTLSAFCSSCGTARGAPVLAPWDRGGGQALVFVHTWHNPCGHQDTPAAILTELACQCIRPDCVIMASMELDPFCGPTCAFLGRGQSADALSASDGDALSASDGAN